MTTPCVVLWVFPVLRSKVLIVFDRFERHVYCMGDMAQKLILSASVILLAGFFAATCWAATPPVVGAFIQKNCVVCHNSSSPAARLDLAKLSYDPADPDNFATWVKIYDRVSAGEMPPAPSPRPPTESLAQFVNSLSGALTGYEKQHHCRARPCRSPAAQLV